MKFWTSIITCDQVPFVWSWCTQSTYSNSSIHYTKIQQWNFKNKNVKSTHEQISRNNSWPTIWSSFHEKNLQVQTHSRKDLNNSWRKTTIPHMNKIEKLAMSSKLVIVQVFALVFAHLGINLNNHKQWMNINLMIYSNVWTCTILGLLNNIVIKTTTFIQNKTPW